MGEKKKQENKTNPMPSKLTRCDTTEEGGRPNLAAVRHVPVKDYLEFLQRAYASFRLLPAEKVAEVREINYSARGKDQGNAAGAAQPPLRDLYIELLMYDSLANELAGGRERGGGKPSSMGDLHRAMAKQKGRILQREADGEVLEPDSTVEWAWFRWVQGSLEEALELVRGEKRERLRSVLQQFVDSVRRGGEGRTCDLLGECRKNDIVSSSGNKLPDFLEFVNLSEFLAQCSANPDVPASW